jgi:iron complex outermembrane receptor protein
MILAVENPGLVFGEDAPSAEQPSSSTLPGEQMSHPVFPQEQSPVPATIEEPATQSNPPMEQTPTPTLTQEEIQLKVRSEEEVKFHTLYSGEEMVNAASLHEESILKAPAVTTIISSDRLENLSYRELHGLLDIQTGISQNTNNLGNKQIVIRGFSKVRVMMDNVEVNGEYDKTIDATYQYMPLKIVKSIEIVRGPLSSLYGENSFGGTVVIKTKDASDIDGATTYGGLGSFRDKSAGILMGKQVGSASLVFNYDYFTTDGPQAVSNTDSLTLFDQGYNYSRPFQPAISPKYSLAPGPTSEWQNRHFAFFKASTRIFEFTGSYLFVEKGSYFSIFNALTNGSDLKNESYLFNLKTSESWVHSHLESDIFYTLNKQDHYYQAFPPGFQIWADLGNPAPVILYANYPQGVLGELKFKTSQIGTDLKYSYDISSTNNLIIGGEIKREDLFDPEYYANFNIQTRQPLASFQDLSNDPTENVNPAAYRVIHGVFIQDMWQIGKVGLTGGLRYDNYSDFGYALSPRFTAVYTLTETQAIKFLYGEAFRPPTFRELYTRPNNVSETGNPNLEPEKLRTEEIRYELQKSSGGNSEKASLGVFNNNADDLIVINPNTIPTTLTNSESVHSQGIEAEGEFRIGKSWDVFIRYTYTNIFDGSRNTAVMLIPENVIASGFSFNYEDRFTITPILLWVGNTPRQRLDVASPGKDGVLGTLDDKGPDGIIDDQRPDHPGYARVDLAIVTGHYFKETVGKLSIINLLNTPYTNPERSILIPTDLPQPGRNIFFEISHNF